ncbi:MAG: C-terminal binding protein, partial [Acetobacteraceae bacterium]
MPTTVLYPDVDYPDDAVERAIYGDGVRVVMAHASSMAALDPAICAETDGIAVTRTPVTARDFARFPRLRVAVRMGVGTDSIDRAEAAQRGVMVC